MKKRLLLLAAIASTGWACTDKFADINSNGTPNGSQSIGHFFNIGQRFLALETNIVICSSTNAYQFNENLTGQPYARYLTITKSDWNVQNFGVFNAPDNWLNALFNDQMTNVYSAWFEIKNLNDKGEVPAVAWAWAELLRVAAVQRTTDMYGPLPYSKIKEGTGALYVRYDTQEEVYAGLFADLDAALDGLRNYVASNSGISSLKDYDVVYGGDFSRWIRFGNSLKLRMALRISYADPVKAAQYAAEALDPAKGGVIESNADIACITRSNVTNPLHIMWNDYQDSRAAAELITYLNGYQDPRLDKYFVPVATGSNAGRYAGMRVGIAIQSHSWACDNFSVPRVEKSDPVLLFSAAEVAFLKAEALACHNWSLPVVSGTAEDCYNEGIRLSFEQWGLARTAADAYLVDNVRTQASYTDDPGNGVSAVSTITVKWDDAASVETKLERIITQKWIALYPLGLEGWSEHRRTGYPRFFNVPVNRSSDNTLSTHGASRIPYGPSEQLNNPTNYLDAVTRDLGGRDGYGVRLWWDAKNPKAGW
ncbi:MAG: SusD/RagB family nutrient-binding outer membrane lipoprotein [Rikenellaceae bacterium]|jgi:hypothetical protein|nr:SusD/RagB family nutrient-binding outer membrane lipoprotein [Rikenellaceae bacterium]